METSISWGNRLRWNPWNLGHWHRRGLRERDSSGRSQPHLRSHKGSCFLMQNLSENLLFLYLNHWSLARWKTSLFRWRHFEDTKNTMRYLQVFFEVEDYACKNLCLWSWLSAMLIPRKLHVTTSLNSSTEGLKGSAWYAQLAAPCWFVDFHRLNPWTHICQDEVS